MRIILTGKLFKDKEAEYKKRPDKIGPALKFPMNNARIKEYLVTFISLYRMLITPGLPVKPVLNYYTE